VLVVVPSGKFLAVRRACSIEVNGREVPVLEGLELRSENGLSFIRAAAVGLGDAQVGEQERDAGRSSRSRVAWTVSCRRCLRGAGAR